MNSYRHTGHCEGAVAVLAEDNEPPIRVDKIMEIRRQLGEGRYNIAEKIDSVVDRLCDALRR